MIKNDNGTVKITNSGRLKFTNFGEIKSIRFGENNIDIIIHKNTYVFDAVP